jgi:S-adenosylmethionine hydrolase
MALITLTTDFGLSDWFVGTMKGVIARLAPRAQVVDLTHGIPSGDVRAGAFALATGCRFFPKGTIQVAVVDPGVGSDRDAIAVQSEDYFFVGPDNGVLSFALRNEKIKRIHTLENKRYFLSSISQTFHGRDIFAPVAAHLAAGVPIQKLGPKQRDSVRLDWPEPRVRGKRVEGEVVYIDRFGNAITNLAATTLDRLPALLCEIGQKPLRKCPVKNCYQAVAVGKPVAVPGSSGFLEIAINDGSAQKLLRLTIGTKVALQAR